MPLQFPKFFQTDASGAKVYKQRTILIVVTVDAEPIHMPVGIPESTQKVCLRRLVMMFWITLAPVAVQKYWNAIASFNLEHFPTLVVTTIINI